ncbi:DUF6389 family protein [Microbacterium sp. NPDC090225]|uniref:DUF6389 family protein n=1 Tax=Microbacterium sp. NPDC090225 TaxID=3364207 RepID=UPI003818BBA6
MASDPYADALHLVLAAHDDEVRERLRLLDEVARAQGDRDVVVEVFVDDDAEGPFDVWARLDGLNAFELEPLLGDRRHLFGVTWHEHGWEPAVPEPPRGWSRDQLQEAVIDAVSTWLSALLPADGRALDWTVESPDGSSDPRPLPVPDSPGKAGASAR